MKKTLFILLSLTLLWSTTLLTACQKQPPTTDAPQETDSAMPEANTADILGFDRQNYNTEFKILLNSATAVSKKDFFTEEGATDLVSVATYDRNLACEEYLGIFITYFPEAANWNSGIAEKLYNLVATGTCDYDLLAIALNAGVTGGYIDIYQNVMQMEYIEPTHTWWVQDVIDHVSLNNQLYFLTGDASVSAYAYIGCVFANLEVADNYRLDVDFYDLVKSGNWTLEEFYRLYKLVGEDLNNDGVYDPATETFGWANHDIGTRLMWSSCDMQLIERQADGTFALRSGLDDRILTFIAAMKNELDNPLSNHIYAEQTNAEAFVGDRVLFVTSMLSMAQNLKANNIESPFAFLPLPKYNAEQTDYISTNMPAYNAFFFPSTMEKPDISAQVAEFMGWYGQEYIIPSYYDQTLKYRQNDAEANIEMLDLIRNKLRVTPNELYGIIGVSQSENVMILTQTIPTNLSENGFYSTPVSVWQTQYPTLSNQIASYVLKYYQ